MILTKQAILKEIKKGNIKITPFKKENIGPASIDLTLDNKFRIIKPEIEEIKLDEKIDYKKFTKPIKTDKIILRPEEFVLGITKERISLSDNLCGWLGGRSRFARLGLLVHATAAFVQPGVNNKQVLEIKNNSSTNFIIKPGLKICQIMLQRTEGKAKYRGKFRKQAL